MLAYDDFGRGVNIIEGNAVLGVGDIGIQVTAGIPLSLPPLSLSSPSHCLYPFPSSNMHSPRQSYYIFFFVIP